MSKKQTLLLILTLAIAVMFANIGGLDVYALDEAKNAEAARTMFCLCWCLFSPTN